METITGTPADGGTFQHSDTARVNDNQTLGLAEFFSGIGGASVALSPAFTTVFSNEINQQKADCQRRNLGHVVDTRSIETVCAGDLPTVVDLAWASFPCQDHSALGKQRGLKNGRRGRLVWEYVRILRERRDAGQPLPTICLENVQTFISHSGCRDFGEVVKALAKLGYRISAVVMEGGDFTAALRKRVFIIAWPARTALPPGLAVSGPDPRWTNAPLCRAVARLPGYARSAWRWITMAPPPPRVSRVEDLLKNLDGDDRQYPEHRVRRWLNDCHQRDVDALREHAGDGTAVGIVDAQRSKCRNDAVRRYPVCIDGTARCLTGGNARQRLLICEGGRFRMRDLSARELARLGGLPEEFKLVGAKRFLNTAVGEGLSIPCVAYLGEHVLAPLAEAVRAGRDPAERRAREAANPPLPPAPPVRERRVVADEAWGQKATAARHTLYLANDDGDRLAGIAVAEDVSKHSLIRTLLTEALVARGHEPLIHLNGGRRDRQPGEDKQLCAAVPQPLEPCTAVVMPSMEEAANDDNSATTHGFFSGGAAHSSMHGDWWTPKELVAALLEALGLKAFTIDAFSPGAELSHIPAETHFTKEDDALQQGWFGDVFGNPPYDRRLKHYVRRCRTAVETREARLVVGVVPARTETRWWAENVVGHADVVFPRGRIDFVDSRTGEVGKSPGHATAIVLWGATPAQVGIRPAKATGHV